MDVAKPRGSHRHFDSAQQEAFLNLWRTYDRLHLVEEELFGRYDLTPQQYNALRLLRGTLPDKLPTLALASQLVSRAPDITRLLDKLETRGLIDRQRPTDNRRVVLVGITAAGQALLADLDEQIQQCHLRQLGHMKPADLRKLISLLYEAREPHEESGSSWL
jgi:DNA-binding MarR family transcriptional regulator